MSDGLGHWLMAEAPGSRRQAILGSVYRGVLAVLSNPTSVVGLVIASADTCANIASGEGSLWLSIAQIIWTPIMIATTTAVTVWVGKKLN